MILDEALLDKIRNNNPRLKKINLVTNKIGDTGVITLCGALKQNTNLNSIKLEFNEIGAAGASAISEVLKDNTSLKEIDLEFNKIGAEGASAIGEALKQNSSLKEIDLACNQIGAVGARAIGEALKDNTSLEAIYLGGNYIGVAGAKFLCEALKHNTSLKNIGLWGNQIGDTGVRAFCEVLKHNSSLEWIDLDDNQISDTGVITLFEALKDYISLKRIDLGGNNIGDAGVIALCEALKTNYTLLDLGGIEHALISACLERNKILQQVNAVQFKAFNEELVEALDGKAIEEVINRLEKLTSDIGSPEDEEDYPSETKRLLTGLGHMTNQGAEIDALYCLLPAFTHPLLQKTADIALGHLLNQKLDTPTIPAFYQLGFYSLREQLHRPELVGMAFSALLKLLEPEKELTIEAIKEMVGKVALLSYKSLLILAEKALSECRKSTMGDLEPEIQMLEALISQDVYRPEMLSFLLQSPSFCLQFNRSYEGKTFLTLPEHSLFATNKDGYLIAIPETVNPVTEEQMSACYRVISHRVEMLHERPLAAIRKQIAEAIGIPGNGDSERLFNNTEGKEKEKSVDELAAGLDEIGIPPKERTEEECRQQFLKKHEKVFNQDRNRFYRFFSCLRSTKVHPGLDLKAILKHAKERNNRSRDVCVELGWLKADGSFGSEAPESVKNAYQTVCQKMKELAP